METFGLFWHFCRAVACSTDCGMDLVCSRPVAGNKPNQHNWSYIYLHQSKYVTPDLWLLSSSSATRQGFFSGPLSTSIAWPATSYRGCKQGEIGMANRSITEYWKDQGSGSNTAKANMEKPFSSNSLILVTKIITRWKMAQHECILVAMIAMRIGTGSYFTHSVYLS